MKRNFLCTINFDQRSNPLDVLPDFTILPGLKQVTFQLEKASRLHWQLFLEFSYPVSIKSIVNNVKNQGFQMHVSDGDGRHPNAGRAYCTKGEAIDGHRYCWSKAHGWVGDKAPTKSSTACIGPVNVRQIEFDGGSRDSIRVALVNLIGECSSYVNQSVVGVKII